MSDTQDREFERRASDALRRSELEIDSKRAQQLQQSRREAVAAAEHSLEAHSTITRWWWVPTGALAAVALIVGIMVNPGTQPLPVLDPAEMSAAQDMELLSELEFMAWMLEQEGAVDDREGTTHAG